MTIIDFGLTNQNTQDGVYDLQVGTDGDLVTIQGFDTALQMSLFCERRADVSEVPVAQRRRGWWGNECGDDLSFEDGSKLWILIEQPRRLTAVLNRAIAYAKDGLQWFIDGGYLDDVKVAAAFTSTGLQINITLLRDQSVVDSKYYDIWEATGNKI